VLAVYLLERGSWPLAILAAAVLVILLAARQSRR
jgi:hypothetical protein